MSILYKKKVAHLVDTVTVEEAEELWQWLTATSRPSLNLSKCTHLHAANLQVLMACQPTISQWPADASLSAWLKPVLTEVKE